MPCSAEIDPPCAATAAIDELVDRLLVPGHERRRVDAVGRLHVVVQVAVAEMAEVDHPDGAGKPAASAASVDATKAGMRDTGSEMSCLMFSPSSACASGMLSRRCHIARDCSMLSASAASPITAVVEHLLEQAFEQLRAHARRFRCPTARAAPSTVPAAAGAAGREMLAHQSQREVVHQLEAGQPGAEPRLRALQQRDRGVDARRTLAQAVIVAAGLREQLQRRGGDDAERAFAADEQVAQVVAGVVLAQPAQAVPDLAVGGDDLEAEAQVARRAVAQHLRAAGVGRQIAADRATAFGRQAEREQQAGVGGRLLHRLQDAAGLDGHASGWPGRSRGPGSSAPG